MGASRQPRKRETHRASAVTAANEKPCPIPVAPETGDFIAETMTVWQPFTQRQLTREDGRQIAANMAGFFRILQEWDRAEREEAKAATQQQPCAARAKPTGRGKSLATPLRP